MWSSCPVFLCQALCCRFFSFFAKKLLSCSLCCRFLAILPNRFCCHSCCIVVCLCGSLQHLLRNPHNHPSQIFRRPRPSQTSSPSSFPGPLGGAGGRGPEGGDGERGRLAEGAGVREGRGIQALEKRGGFQAFVIFCLFSCFHYFHFLIICLLSPKSFPVLFLSGGRPCVLSSALLLGATLLRRQSFKGRIRASTIVDVEGTEGRYPGRTELCWQHGPGS